MRLEVFLKSNNVIACVKANSEANLEQLQTQTYECQQHLSNKSLFSRDYSQKSDNETKEVFTKVLKLNLSLNSH